MKVQVQSSLRSSGWHPPLTPLCGREPKPKARNTRPWARALQYIAENALLIATTDERVHFGPTFILQPQGCAPFNLSRFSRRYDLHHWIAFNCLQPHSHRQSREGRTHLLSSGSPHLPAPLSPLLLPLLLHLSLDLHQGCLTSCLFPCTSVILMVVVRLPRPCLYRPPFSLSSSLTL